MGPDSAKDEKCQNNYENRQTGWVRIYYTRNSRLVLDNCHVPRYRYLFICGIPYMFSESVINALLLVGYHLPVPGMAGSERGHNISPWLGLALAFRVVVCEFVYPGVHTQSQVPVWLLLTHLSTARLYLMSNNLVRPLTWYTKHQPLHHGSL